MRRTTTSPGTFCSLAALSALVAVVACGKRGPPLPPLRPVPAAAEAVTIGQTGNLIRLEWRAPTRNADGTTEKLDLHEVEIRRRVIDLPALIEEQTEIREPEQEIEEEEEEPAEDVVGAEEPVAEEEAAAAAEPEAAPGEPEPEAAPGEPAEPTSEPASQIDEIDEMEAEEPEPEAAPAPALKIPDFAPSSRPLATLESTQPGQTMSYEDEIDPAWIGQRIEYAVVYINQKNRRGPRSRVVQIDPVPALPVPGQPTAEAQDGFVSVTWPAPDPMTVRDPDPESELEEEEPKLHFSLFRRAESAAAYPDRPIHPVPLAEPKFEDRAAVFGVPSCYIVRTVPAPPPPPEPEPDLAEPETDTTEPETEPAPEPEPDLELEPEPDPEVGLAPDEPIVIVPVVPPVRNEVRIESAASPEVCLTPIDTFAPPSPTGLVALVSGDEVLLTWSVVDRADVAGYRVYRADRQRGPFSLLNDELVTAPSFTDRTTSPGQNYFYYVSAVDDAPGNNESEPSETKEVRIAPR